ncbi:DUF2079 domain-containing protein [Streptococcus suis]
MISKMKKQLAGLAVINRGDWLHFFINAYLIYGIVQQLVRPVNPLYFVLEPSLSIILLIFILIFLVVGLYEISRKFPFLKKQEVTHLLLGCYMTGVIVKSPSLMIVFGFLLLACGIYAKLCLDDSPVRGWYLGLLFLSLPKVVYLIYFPFIGIIDRFIIKTEDWDYRRLWLICILVVYCLLAVILLHFVSKKYPAYLSGKKSDLILASSILAVVALYVTYLSVVLAYKVTIFSVSTFDIGIFTQMFEGMRRNFLPITTLERDKVLSHFAVHISPIYYLLLPIYYILPYGETLEVLQVLVVFSGIFPLFLILKELQLPAKAKWLGILLFTVTPAMTTAGSYHIHENCFLPPLLLWLIYANIKQWKAGLWLVSLLTLLIKEDAFIYVVSVAGYFLFQSRFQLKKKQKIQIVLSQVLFPLVYFVSCLYFLNQFGEGAMVSRFENFLLQGQEGLSAVLSNVIINPTYAIASLFTQSKLHYLLIVFAAQLFLPLVQKEWVAYILFIPLVVINLLSDYAYQADINFQYSYGTNVLLLFMSFMTLEHLYQRRIQKEAKLLTYSLLVSSIIMSAGLLYSYSHNWYLSVQDYVTHKEKLDVIHDTLDTVPKDKKILAFTGYTVELREAPELYDLFYHNNRELDESVDLVVMKRDLMEAGQSGSNVVTEVEVVNLYLKAGYQESQLSNKEVLVLEKPVKK